MIQEGITIERLRETVYQDSKLTVVGETDVPSSSWDEFRTLYLAPKKSTYSIRGIRKVYDHLERLGFHIGIAPRSDDYALNFGFGELENPKRKLLVSVYPDAQTAEEVFKDIKGRLDGTLKSSSLGEALSEWHIRNDELRKRAMSAKLRPFLSAFTSLKKILHIS